MSSVFAVPLATKTAWRYLFAITPILCIVQFFIAPFLLESPRWLLSKDESSSIARAVIKRLRGFRSDFEVESEVQHYLFAASKHDPLAGPMQLFTSIITITRELWMQPPLRLLFLCALGLQAAQQLSGVNAIFYYSTTFFAGVIPDPLLGTILISVCNVLATYVALKLMDSTPRRTLLLMSCFGMLFSTILITASLNGEVLEIFLYDITS